MTVFLVHGGWRGVLPEGTPIIELLGHEPLPEGSSEVVLIADDLHWLLQSSNTAAFKQRKAELLHLLRSSAHIWILHGPDRHTSDEALNRIFGSRLGFAFGGLPAEGRQIHGATDALTAAFAGQLAYSTLHPSEELVPIALALALDDHGEETDACALHYSRGDGGTTARTVIPFSSPDSAPGLLSAVRRCAPAGPRGASVHR